MANTTPNFGLLQPLTSETFDLNEYNTNLSKIDTGMNNPTNIQTKLPLGLVAKVESTAQNPNITSLFVWLAVQFTFKANRNYRCEFYGGVTSNLANSEALAHLYTDLSSNSSTNTTGLTEIQGTNIFVNNASNQTVKFYVKRDIKYTSDTTVWLKGVLDPIGDTLTTQAGTTYPGQLTITDMGMQI